MNLYPNLDVLFSVKHVICYKKNQNMAKMKSCLSFRLEFNKLNIIYYQVGLFGVN